ncbi:WD40 repeat domain-containing protein [Actinoplanes sp. CA-054009]
MSRTSRVAFALVVVLGAAVVVGIGLDRADKLASVLGFFVGLAGLLITVSQAHRPTRTGEAPLAAPSSSPSIARPTAHSPVTVRTPRSGRPGRQRLREAGGTVIAVVIVVLAGIGAIWIRDSIRDDEPKSVVWRGALTMVAELRAAGVVRGFAFSPDGKSMAMAADNVEIWDIGSRAHRKQIDIQTPIHDVAYSPNGQMLAATGYSERQTVRVWSVSDWRVVSDNLSGGTSYSSVAWHANNQTLVTAGEGGVQVWLVGEAAFRGSNLVPAVVRQVRLSPDGALLAVVAGDATSPEGVEVFRYPEIDRVMRFQEGDSQVEGLAISRNGASLAAGFDDGRILVWNLSRLTDPPAILQREGSSIMGLSFSPEGKLIAATDRSGAIKVWSVAERVVVASADGLGPTEVEFSPDGRELAVVAGQRILLFAPAGD